MPAWAIPETPPNPQLGWSRTDLKQPRPLLAGIAGLVVTAPLALVLSCNMHEIGHGMVGTLLGWEVERVNLCLPTGGSVEYARIGTWAGNAQGYAGGLTAAAFLTGVYVLIFARRARPLRGPGWWAGGLSVVLWVGPQLVIGVLEGSAGQRGDDYTDYVRDSPVVFVALIGVAMAAGAAAYAWRWRAVWGRRESDGVARGP